MSRFDDLAKNWDDKPENTERALVFANNLLDEIPVSKNWEALEYGCGTAILSFILSDNLKFITLADESTEMLKVAKSKIEAKNINNMETLELNLVNEIHEYNYDLIYTALALHHINDTNLIIKKFYEILNNKGFLCIFDLVEEDGSFHAHLGKVDVHNGFNLTKLENLLISNNFSQIKSKIVYKINKRDHNTNEQKEYQVFMMIAQKNNN